MPQTQPTPTIMFDHIENAATLMASDAALRKLTAPQTVAATNGIPKASQ